MNEISAAVIEKPVVEPGPAKSREPAPAAPAAAPRHVFLIDGSGFIFRAYFARARDPNAERFQRKSDGMPTEVVMHFSNMLDKYRRETDADRMAVIFDASGASFRNRIYEGYKANRREMPDDLIPQLEHVRRAADAFDICRIEMEGYEADDLIGTLARQAAEQGHKLAINELALAYINGNLDIPEAERESAAALRWISAAADNGYVTAMERMATAYRNGEFGLEADQKTADQWSEKTRKALGLKQLRRKNR